MLLVVGASGNVGRGVLEALSKESAPLRAFVRDPAKLGPQPGQVEIVRGDFSDNSSVERAVDGVETLFLAGALAPNMVEQQKSFVAAAKRAGVRRVVQLSCVGASAKRCCARTLSWLGQIEDAVALSGLEFTTLRPAFYMQNLLAYAPAIRSDGVLSGPFRATRWTWVDTRDVAEIAALAMRDSRHAGKTYTLTSNDRYSYTQVAEQLSTVAHRPIRYVDITANEARGRLQASGREPVMVEAMVELWDACTAELLQIEPTATVRELTGHEPLSLADFIRGHRQDWLSAA
jgi:uncharacterized protein YbjT (DUF2867 family)